MRISLISFVVLAGLFGCRNPAPREELRPQPRIVATYRNPALPGDHPDPSSLRGGAQYWASSSSVDWAPLFPLLRSADLVNWTTVGAVFPKSPAWAVGDFWAPELSQDGDRFYVYYTARKRGGPLCVAVATATQPEGPYKDGGPLVCQEDGAIDAFPVRDA